MPPAKSAALKAASPFEEGEGRRGDAGRVGGVGREAEAGEAEVLAAAEDVAEETAGEVLAEDEAVTEAPPHEDAHGGEGEALGRDGEHVLAADQAAVEKEETRDAHHQDQGGADQDPDVIGGVRRGSGRNKHVATY